MSTDAVKEHSIVSEYGQCHGSFHLKLHNKLILNGTGPDEDKTEVLRDRRERFESSPEIADRGSIGCLETDINHLFVPFV